MVQFTWLNMQIGLVEHNRSVFHLESSQLDHYWGRYVCPTPNSHIMATWGRKGLSLGSRVYPNGQGSWERPGRGKRCACYVLAARPACSRLALRTHDLGFALAVCATRSRLGLCPDNNEMNSFITIKWIHQILHCKHWWIHLQNLCFICKIDEFICKNLWIHLQKSMNSSNKWIH